MKVSELIYKLEFIKRHYGDLEVFDSNIYADPGVFVRNGEDFPDDYNLPEKIVIIGDD